MNTVITHRTVIASLSPEIRKALRKRSDLAGSKQLACHFGLILLSSLYLYFKLPFWPILLPIQGILLVFLFTAMHETIHATAFKTPWINKAITHICGVIIFLPASWFRHFHFAHHRYTNQPDLDPELLTPKPQTRFEYLLYLSGIPVAISLIKTLIINALGKNKDDFIENNHRRNIATESIVYLSTYFQLGVISFSLHSTILLWLWLLPLVLGQPFLRAYLLAEHAFCPQVKNMLINSRTTLSHSFINFIAWNMPYHAEHHSLPSVPFYKLPELHNYLNEYLVNKQNGYIEFHKNMNKSLKDT